MRVIIATTVVLAVLASGPTLAGEKAGDPGTNVEMPFLIAPMLADGKLTSYAYVSAKVVTTSRNAALDVRDKIPFIQDAFVRDVNTSPIRKTDGISPVDRAALSARLTADVRRIIGTGKIAAVVIIQVQIASLHPAETPVQNASAIPPN